MRKRLSILAAVALLCWSDASLAESRFALVIGISKYDGRPLDQAALDAKLVADALENARFKVVRAPEATHSDMRRKLDEVVELVEGGQDATVFVYYAGHAAQVNGTTWLIPRDATDLLGKTSRRSVFEERTRPADVIIRDLVEAGARKIVFVLDACRDDPGRPTVGLTRLNIAAPAGVRVLVAFAAAEGEVASETSGFAGSMVKAMMTPGLKFMEAMSRITDEVEERTRNTRRPQKPAIFGQVDLILVPQDAASQVRNVDAAGTGSTTSPSAGSSIIPPPAESSGSCAELTAEARLRRYFSSGTPAQLRGLAAKGNGEALYLIGLAHSIGSHGFVRDRVLAEDALREAVARGEHKAINSLGYSYAMDADGPKNYAIGNAWFATGRKLGLGTATRNLAIAHRDGNGMKRDLKTAEQLFVEAANQGNSCALRDAARLYVVEEYGQIDRAKARSYYELGSKVNDHDAIVDLAQSYRFGLAADRSDAAPRKALDILSEAAEKGCAKCWGEGASIAAGNELGGVNDEFAFAFYERGWKANDTPSTLEFARRLKSGKGATADPARAVAVYAKASASPDKYLAFQAAGSLGQLYAKGEGIRRDPVAAARLLRQVLIHDKAGDPDRHKVYEPNYWGYGQELAKLIEGGDVSSERTDEANALRLRYGPADGMKRFTVPIDCSGQKIPFDFYVINWSRPNDETPVDVQAAWLREERGCKFPPDVLDTFRKLKKIARESQLCYTDLTVYALGANATGGQQPMATKICRPVSPSK